MIKHVWMRHWALLCFVPYSGCVHGRWNCSLEHCPVDGGLSPWGPWSSCSLSCGGLGVKTRARGCVQPAPAYGGRDCKGPRQETTYCQAPECPGTEGRLQYIYRNSLITRGSCGSGESTWNLANSRCMPQPTALRKHKDGFNSVRFSDITVV